jgi:type IV pilus assembly protein PilC
MPTFVAQIRDGQGRVVKQKVQADTARDARGLLQGQGLFVQELKQEQAFSIKDLQKFNFNEITASVTVKDKAVFSRQLAVMQGAGVPLVRALGILSDNCVNPKLKRALIQLSNDVQQGTNMSESMRKFPHCFDSLYVAMIQAGEVGGVLDEVLERLSRLLEDTARLQNQIKSAMSYPVTVGSFAILVFLGMTMFLIPVFAGIFQQIGGELPLFTQIMLNISSFLRNPINLVVMGGVIFGSSFGIGQYYRTPVGRKMIDSWMLKLPLFGDIIQKNAVARFSRTFSALTRAGVPILTALEIVRDTSGNQVIADAIDNSRKEVQSGGMLSGALNAEKAFPVMAIQMMMIGEETGELDAMLAKVADFYEDEVEQAVKAMTSVMEPLMIVVVGIMVGSILLSMYLPMFKVFDQLG